MNAKIYKKLFVSFILLTIFLVPTVYAVTFSPTVGDFRITSFSDFGEIQDTKTLTITITCIEGGGSSQVSLTTIPDSVPVSFTPVFGLPALSEGESYTADFQIQNLGTETTLNFGINATVNNSIGTVTDTKTVYGTLLIKTGQPTETDTNSEQQLHTDNNQLVIIILALILVIALLIGIIFAITKKKHNDSS